MKIRMKVSISGTRDGAEWPEKGGVIDLPEEEAKHLVATNLAETAPPDAEAEQEAQAKKEQEETVNDNTPAPSEEVPPAEENAAAPATEEKAVPARKTTAPRKAPAKK